MLQNIRSILIGITEEGDVEERSSALTYGLRSPGRRTPMSLFRPPP